MRRFIASLTGRIVSHVVILAMVMPLLSLALVTRANAQVAIQPTWAVTEFKNLKSPGTKFGQVAAESVAGELVKANEYDVVPQEGVKRVVKDLGLTLPLESLVNLLRVGSELRASTIVTGDIVDYKVDNVNGGKQARVAFRVKIYDVAAGIAINGAAVMGESTVRSGDVTDETLVDDAIGQASVLAIKQIRSRNLPSGTILNTTGDVAIVNQGKRVGFTEGQKLIIKRGRQQVATAVVSDTEPDQCTVTALNAPLGIRPGDKAVAIYDSFNDIDPRSPFTADNQLHVKKGGRRGNNSQLVTTVLVVGLLVALLGGPGSGGQGAVSDVTAEAEVYPYGTTTPAIYVSWSPNGFAKGNANRFAWQVWRHDFPSAPVLVVPGTQIFAHDMSSARTDQTYSKFDGTIGGTTCVNTAPNDASFTGQIQGVIPGTPYIYSNELVYSLSGKDLPKATDDEVCYFLSDRVTARGTATALTPPVPVRPSSAFPISSASNQFYFQNSATTVTRSLEYVVQISRFPDFPRDGKNTYTFPAFRLNAGPGESPSPSYTLFGSESRLPANLKVLGAKIYWRVGSKNPNDRPGPVKDPTTGLRYIFGAYGSYTIPGSTPPPPG